MKNCPSGCFDKPLARHLVNLIHSGHGCDPATIRHGYHLTRWELGLHPIVRQDEGSRQLEADYAEEDTGAVANHEGAIRRLPFNQASALVLSLLRREPGTAPA